MIWYITPQMNRLKHVYRNVDVIYTTTARREDNDDDTYNNNSSQQSSKYRPLDFTNPSLRISSLKTSAGQVNDAEMETSDDRDDADADDAQRQNEQQMMPPQLQQHATAKKKQQNLEKNKKPILYLHVGPLKTGTTTIQTSLLDNRQMNVALAKDRVIKVTTFGYKDFHKLLSECLWHDDNEDAKSVDCSRWDKYLSALNKAANQTTTANNNKNIRLKLFHSTETLSCLPRNNRTISLLRSLQDTYNVIVLVVYRPIYSWYPSAYKQYMKGQMYLSSADRYINYNGHVEYGKTIPQLISDTFENNYNVPVIFREAHHIWRDSYSTIKYYEEIFGKESIRIVNMNAPEGLGVTFICDGMKELQHSCETVKKQKVKVTNTNDRFLYDHDLIVQEAYYRQKLKYMIPLVLSRHEATLTLNDQLQDWNMTTKDLPLECLSQFQQEQLWNRTLLAEQQLMKTLAEKSSTVAATTTNLSLSPTQIVELRQKFESVVMNSTTYCSVNASKVLQNTTWRNFFIKNISCSAIKKKKKNKVEDNCRLSRSVQKFRDKLAAKKKRREKRANRIKRQQEQAQKAKIVKKFEEREEQDDEGDSDDDEEGITEGR